MNKFVQDEVVSRLQGFFLEIEEIFNGVDQNVFDHIEDAFLSRMDEFQCPYLGGSQEGDPACSIMQEYCEEEQLFGQCETYIKQMNKEREQKE